MKIGSKMKDMEEGKRRGKKGRGGEKEKNENVDGK